MLMCQNHSGCWILTAMMWGPIVQHRANQLLPYIATSITQLWGNDPLFGPYKTFHCEHILGAQFRPGKHWYLSFYSLFIIFAPNFPMAVSSAPPGKNKASIKASLGK